MIIVSGEILQEVLNRERQEGGGLSGLSVKLWVPTAEDVLQIVVKDFRSCL